MKPLSPLAVVFAVAIFAAPAFAQKTPPWEVTAAKISGSSPSPQGGEVKEFGGDNKEREIFLHVTLKFQKTPTLNTVRTMRIIDKKKKAIGEIFHLVVDKDDKKTVTLIFQNRDIWTSTDELSLKSSSHTAALKK